MNSLKVKYDKLIWLVKKNPWAFFPNAKVLNYLSYKCGKYKVSYDFKKFSPVFVSYLITNRCNLSCPFCIVGSSINVKGNRKEATLEKTKEIFNTPVLKKTLNIMLSGGEPTLVKDLEKIIRYLKSQKRFVSINTNGARLAGGLEGFLDAGLDAANVSLYPENYELLRKILPSVSSKINTKIVKVINSAMLENTAPIEQAIELGINAGCSGVYLQNTFPTPNAPSDQSGNVIYDIHQKQYNAVINCLKKRYGSYPIYWPEVAPLKKTSKNLCRMPWYFLSVDSDGNTGMCCLDPDCNQKSVLEYPPEDIMNEEKWLKVRKRIIGQNAEKDCLCQGCFLLNDRYGSNV